MNSSTTPPPANPRAVIGLIVQRSTIELFDAYGVAVAPIIEASPRVPSASRDQLLGTVQLSTEGLRGLLKLSCAGATLARMKPSADLPHGLQDWMRELTNQLAGRIKNRFSRYRVQVQVGLPSATPAVTNEVSREPTRDTLVYVFRTLRDDVVVSLSGGFDNANFDLQGGLNPAEEGDIILF
jgi:hypothetical protein